MMKRNIYERIGWKGLLNIAWNSTPCPARLFALPYALWIYRGLLKRSSCLGELLRLHSNKYVDSKIFRLFRPRYHEAKMVLEAYGIQCLSGGNVGKDQNPPFDSNLKPPVDLFDPEPRRRREGQLMNLVAVIAGIIAGLLLISLMQSW